MSRGAFAGISPGSGGVQFKLFGFPATVQWSFFLVVGLLGLAPNATVASIAIWVGVAGVSIMWHELGHAFAARRLGSEPRIVLYSFGGLTYWQPEATASRWQMISVSLAGPGAGLLLGGVVALVAVVLGQPDDGLLRFFIVVVLWINIGWGLVNLLPVLPLDGGHVLAELLPGTRDQRWRRAAWVSVATGVIGAVVLFFFLDLQFGALVFGWAVMTNINTLRQPRQAEKARELDAAVIANLEAIARRDEGAIAEARQLAPRLGTRGPTFKLVAVEHAAAAGDGAGARSLLSSIAGQAPPAMYALVTAVETGGLQGLDELRELFARHLDADHVRWLGIGLLRAGRFDSYLDHVHNVASPQRTAEMLSAAIGLATWANKPVIANDLRSLA